MKAARGHFKWLSLRAALTLSVLVGCAAASLAAQDPAKQPETAPTQGQSKNTQGSRSQPGLGAQLAQETRAAAGEEDEVEQFKHAPSVRFLARITGLDLQVAYWMVVTLNFVVIAVVLFWAARKYLPGALQARTAAIQRAIEEARRASEEANRRLAEIESRLSRLGDEIATLKSVGEQEMAAEEARAKAAAQEEAQKIVASAEQEIATAAKAARRDLTAYAADLAVALAKKQIHVDATTDASLVRSFTQRLADSGSERDN